MNKRPISSSQLISTFGIGSIYSFPGGDSLILLGLDAWWKKYEELNGHDQSNQTKRFAKHHIRENRLAKRLGVSFFLKPIQFEQEYEKYNSNVSLPYHRFPLWHWCTNCGYMRKLQPTDMSNEQTRCHGKHGTCKKRKEKGLPLENAILKLTAESLCLSLPNKKIKELRISNLFGDNFTNQI